MQGISLGFLPAPSFEKHLTSRSGCEYDPSFASTGTHQCLLRRVLSAKVKTKDTTARCHAEILELKKLISQNFSELCQSQHILMPGLIPIFDKTHNDENTKDLFKL